MKKRSSKIPKLEYSSDDVKRYIGAVTEKYEDGLKVLGEGIMDIKSTQDLHTKILESHTEMVGQLMEDVTILKEDVSVLKKDVGILKEDVSVLKEDMGEVKNDLKIKLDRSEFVSLERRVRVLESKSR